MTTRGQALAQKFTATSDAVLAFVENCSDADWRITTTAEGWTIGVVANHIAASHFGILDWIKMIVNDGELPPVSGEQIDQFNAKLAADSVAVSQAEVLATLRANGGAITAYLAGLSDEQLYRKAYLKLADTEMSTQQLVDVILIDLTAQHLASARAAIA